jgi:peptide/nickel transport system permease protein
MLLLGILASIIFPAMFAPYPPDKLDAPYGLPGKLHLLGTNAIGADNLTILIYSTGTSLFIGIMTTTIATILGTMLGIAAGYRRGGPDKAIMAVTDLFLLIPSLPLLILVSAYSTPGPWGLVIILSLTSWPASARVVRAAVLPFESMGFVRSAKGLGASSLYITTRHILPHVKGIIIGKALTVAAGAMAAEGGIAFLGLADPRTMSWGAMIHDAFTSGAFINAAYWWYLPPVSAISIVVLILTFLGRKIGETQHPNLFADILPSQKEKAANRPPIKEGLSVCSLSVQLTPFGKGIPHTALDNVSLSVREGERMAIIGQTGGGKSILLAAILRLLPEETTASGEIWFENKSILELTNREIIKFRSRDASYVPQGTANSMNPLIRVGRQIIEASVIHRGIKHRQVETQAVSLLRRLHITEPEQWMKTYPHRLSGGMMQRALVATAMMSDAPLILLDEPTKGLDSSSEDAVIQELLRHSQRSFLVATHDLSFVRRFATKVVVIHASRIVEQCSCDAFFESPLHPCSKALLDSYSEEWMPPAAGLGNVRTDDKNGGCSFRQWCPDAFAECSQEPPIMEITDQQVRCWKYATGCFRHS